MLKHNHSMNLMGGGYTLKASLSGISGDLFCANRHSEQVRAEDVRRQPYPFIASTGVSESFKNKYRKAAFTLVEVLITVGIIGVVAALTIPTIIQNSNNRKFASQFKKTLSTLSQAAIMSQAQYDSDYSSLNTASSVDDCGSESLAKSNLTMCGLLNSTLSGHTFLGMYGTAKGANARSIYTVARNSLPKSALSEENTMIFALADGSLIGFNKNAKNCGVMPGTPIDGNALAGVLENCIGFIDVNGPNPPNKEIACKGSTATCTEDKKIGDVFPVVFHNATVEPVTVAMFEQAAKARRLDFSKWTVTERLRGLTQSECEALPTSYGINKENCGSVSSDQWAAAVAACGGVQNLPTDDELYDLAKYLYGESNCNYSNKQCNGTIDFSKAPGLENAIWAGNGNLIVLWSSTENEGNSANRRLFSISGTSIKGSIGRTDTASRVVCLGDL